MLPGTTADACCRSAPTVPALRPPALTEEEEADPQFMTPNVELTGPVRQDGLARSAKMHRVPPTGPSWPAVAGPVERRVRP
jgi:hypothetical protein